MSMRVIGAGLPRTGTLTQKVALEQLGLGSCYHWVDVLADLDGQVPLWNRALDGEAVGRRCSPAAAPPRTGPAATSTAS